MLKYNSALIVVEDIAVSRRFYEDCLGQKVIADFGENVAFEGGFAIHRKAHFHDLLGGGERFAPSTRSHSGELYFETGELEACEQRLQKAGVEFIHPVREQPWAQRVLRCYDPDGHVLEIGETMEAVVQRLHAQGTSVESICRRTGMLAAFVEMALAQMNEKSTI